MFKVSTFILTLFSISCNDRYKFFMKGELFMTNGSEQMVMPVAPMYGGNNSGFGNGCFGGDWAWIILLLLLAGNGWGNGFGGGFGGDGVMPYLWNTQTQNDVNRGFDTSSLSGQLNGIQSAITNGFASAEVANCNRAMDSMQTAYNNQIASMNQRFADMGTINQGFNNVSAQLANCCCENRLAVANLGSDIAREACADRQAVSDGVKDILANQNSGIQRILDQMCSDKLDAKNERIADLERQLTMANLAASQTAQTSRLLADNAAQTVALEQYLNPVPVPAYIVQNPNCCAQNFGCGCGA